MKRKNIKKIIISKLTNLISEYMVYGDMCSGTPKEAANRMAKHIFKNFNPAK